MPRTATHYAVPLRCLALGALLGGIVAALSWSDSLGLSSTPFHGTPVAGTPLPVPLEAMGDPISYVDNWTVNVTEATATKTIGPAEADGTFIKIVFIITNNGTDRRSFPFSDLTLQDENNRTSTASVSSSTFAGRGWNFGFNPSLPTDTGMAFDVAADAMGPYILESRADPTFRVQVTLAVEPEAATPVPPSAAGELLPYGDAWTITIGEASIMATIGPATATGKFVSIVFTITNGLDTARSFPFSDLILVDEQGRRVGASVSSSTFAGRGWNFAFSPMIPTETSMGFDVDLDSEGPFILESRDDPTFRVEVPIERRG